MSGEFHNAYRRVVILMFSVLAAGMRGLKWFVDARWSDVAFLVVVVACGGAMNAG